MQVKICEWFLIVLRKYCMILWNLSEHYICVVHIILLLLVWLAVTYESLSEWNKLYFESQSHYCPSVSDWMPQICACFVWMHTCGFSYTQVNSAVQWWEPQSRGARNVSALIPVRDRRCFSRSPLVHMSGPGVCCSHKTPELDKERQTPVWLAPDFHTDERNSTK